MENANYYLSKKIIGEFESVLGCGILSKGFIRMVCKNCKKNRFVAFSCKKRGFCPSCCGRRMNEGAAFLVDHVIPHLPIRQWVVSFPIPLRFWMAKNPKLMSDALRIFLNILQKYYVEKTTGSKLTKDFQTGFVTVIQRFGGALNLNIHFHILALEGAYDLNNKNSPAFKITNKPTNIDVQNIIKKYQLRMLKLLQRRGLIAKHEYESSQQAFEEDNVYHLFQGASITHKIATGEQVGKRVRKIGSFGKRSEPAFSTHSQSAIVGGYSLHAGTYIHQNDRMALEKLCRYLLRPPVAEKRCEIKHGKLRYHLKRPWSDGTTAVEFTGSEFIEKLIALIPPTRVNLTRFHGILAPNAKYRSKIVPQSTAQPPSQLPKSRRLSWAQLLKRVFKVDLESCSCGGKLKFVAAIMSPTSIQKILEHEGLKYEIPDFAPP